MSLSTLFPFWTSSDYYLTRFVFQRALGLVYLIAFIVVVHQFKPLLGEKGLLPVPQFIKYVRFWESPSIFFFFSKDWAFMLFGWIGIVLSLLAFLGISERFGLFASMMIWTLLWFIYLSFVNVGQTFYGFGWESMLLETGFLAIFLGDMRTRVPVIIILLLRWVLFRDMFGAGLIKLRGDQCWKDLTCLFYHYETQPIPNPLSWYFHWMPLWFNKFGVLFNHFVELIVPFGYFFLQPIAAIAGLFSIFFQGILMVSGNFAFLNLLTIVLAISTLNDSLLSKIIPLSTPAILSAPTFHTIIVFAVTAIICLLSIKPFLNLIAPYQIMNTNFDPLHLVNTYGAFGSITKVRYEIIIEGTNDKVILPSTRWKSYEFFGKPGDITKHPPQIAPYHLRLDWLMWFATMDSFENHPWFIHLLNKLLLGDKDTLSLFRIDPFPKQNPIYVRALLYEYKFTTPEEHKKSGNWWKRTYVGSYFPPVSLHNPQFQNIIKELGWTD